MKFGFCEFNQIGSRKIQEDKESEAETAGFCLLFLSKADCPQCTGNRNPGVGFLGNRGTSELANLPYKSMEAEDIKVYNDARSDSTGSLCNETYREELLHLEITCRELRDERETLQTSLLTEQSKNCQIIKDMEAMVDELTKAHEKDERHIQNLELELKKFSECLGYLHEEIEVKNIEANRAVEHAQNLEIKLSDSEKLFEKVNDLREELAKCEADRLALKQVLEGKNSMLQQTINCMSWLEEQNLENSMKFECEIDTMRQELVKLEEKYICGKSNSEEGAEVVKQKAGLINNLEDQLEMAQQTIICLQKEGKQLQEDVEKADTKARNILHKVNEHLDQWLSRRNALEHVNSIESYNNVTSLAGNKLSGDIQSSNICSSNEDVEILFSKLVMVKNMEEKSIEEARSMAQQLSQLHTTIAQLKEELREEKKKAKEEAEDLTQEMAELRYQLMEMLEQERELRACTEQISLDRIEQLEAQLEEEGRQTLAAVARFHEAEKVAKAQAKEIDRLKLSLHVYKEVEGELRNSQNREAQIRAECAELATQVDWLNEKLMAAEREIHVGNEEHVKDLIRYEEDPSWIKCEAGAANNRLADQLTHVKQTLAEKTAELDVMQEKSVKSLRVSSYTDRHEPEVTLGRQEEHLKHEELHTEGEKQIEMLKFLGKAHCKLSVAEAEIDSRKTEIEHLLSTQHETEHWLSAHMKEIKDKECTIQELQSRLQEQEILLHLCEEELRSEAGEHRKVLDCVAALESDVQLLQQSLCSSQLHIEELRVKLEQAQQATVFERRKASKFEEEARLKTEKIAMQNEKLVQSQVRYNNLYKNFTYLQSKINNSQRKEKEALSRIEGLNLELFLAKEEVVKSEVRMQKVLKQAKEQLNSERRKNEELVSAHKQAEWFMNKQHEKPEKLEKENVEYEAQTLQNKHI